MHSYLILLALRVIGISFDRLILLHDSQSLNCRRDSLDLNLRLF